MEPFPNPNEVAKSEPRVMNTHGILIRCRGMELVVIQNEC